MFTVKTEKQRETQRWNYKDEIKDADYFSL